MKRILLTPILLAMVLTFSFAGHAPAQGWKGFGIIVGEPTGISGKIWMNETKAFDGAVAWSFTDETKLHFHADMLYHNWDVLADALEVTKGRLPLYYGIGGRVRVEDEARVGARFVVGASYIFPDAPFDIFLELAPIMDIIPKTELNANAGIGCRFWF